MKKNICYILLSLIIACVIYISLTDTVKNESISIAQEVKYVDSKILISDVEEIEVTEEIKETEIVIETDNSEGVVNVDKVQIESNIVEEESITEEVEVSKTQENEVLVGRMSGYGPDCKGCSGYLAYGMYVGDGTIYYNDSEYGMVRIVAGDKQYKFGTIVKINNSMLAIVLDRGGAIGIGKSFLFDLLYPSEAEANQNGILKDATFEILRYGF